jgi:hypothetical protein
MVRLICWRSREHRRLRNPLSNPLMWPSLIVVPDIDLEETVELFLMQDQEMIQAFSPDTSQKATSGRFEEHGRSRVLQYVRRRVILRIAGPCLLAMLEICVAFM